ncbi:MAG: MMPL family transporter [Pseudomonas sp.]|nr:MMPL family transporter [Pseudomonas sp.]
MLDVIPEQQSKAGLFGKDWLERLVFNHRLVILVLCALTTLALGWAMLDLRLNASFSRMIPLEHPYIVNFNKHYAKLTGGKGNDLRIAVESHQGTIFSVQYLDTLQRLTDEIFLVPGVDRAYVKSIWSSSARWGAVTEEGFEGGTIIPDGFSGSDADVQQVRVNIERSGELGRLVGTDFRSALIYVPLHDRSPETGEALDYADFAVHLEAIRAKYESEGVTVRVIGFAQLIGDLIGGMRGIFFLFAGAVVISALGVYWYTRSHLATALVVACSLIAVVWQLGILSLLSGELDPYAILVPFLVFAIGMSHGAQKMIGVMADIGAGHDKLSAARSTFRRLFAAGFSALICDAVGFLVLLLVGITVIRELAVNATIGVVVLIFTNLICLPLLLSYTGVEKSAAQRAARAHQDGQARHRLWRLLGLFCRPRVSAMTLALAFVLFLGGLWVSKDLRIGDLDIGAPELRVDSRYNQDVAYINRHYSVSSDLFVVMAETEPGMCGSVDNLALVDRLEHRLRHIQGVLSTQSLASLTKIDSVGMNEGSLKWYDLSRDQSMLNAVLVRAPRELFNHRCDWLSVFVYLTDHRAETLHSLVTAVEDFAQANNTGQTRIVLGAGNAGIEAATNLVVREANDHVLYLVYVAVGLLCFITFRSWRAVLLAMVPLVLTSILAEALMVKLGIGVKVATLPVVALGVGIGVDYAIYLLAILLDRLKRGMPLEEAYHEALRNTGKVVILTGFTLCLAVITWVVSPIKFQADMGLMLAFMFLFNMINALILIPAMARWLYPRVA